LHRVRAWLVLGLLLLLGGSAIGDPGPTPQPAIAYPGPLPVYRAVNGVLDVTLVAAPGRQNFGPVTLDTMTYNGIYGGPVLMLHPGDRLRVKLVNHLSVPTNIHYHGLEASPLHNGDNIYVLVAPGNSFQYDLKIPLTQPPGLYWYHSHTHGDSDRQVSGGLSGMLVIEGLTDQFAALKHLSEKYFALKEISFADSDDPVIAGYFHRRVQSINGALTQTIAMRPGETQLWGFSNQNSNLALDLQLKGHHFRVIARDGEAATRETVTDTLRIEPASRVEALVDAGPAGEYDLVSRRVVTGEGAARKLERVLGQVIVAGAPAIPIPTLTDFPQPLDLATRPVDIKRTIVFTENADALQYFINGRLFDHNRVDVRVPLGNVEEWTIRNDTDDLHVFHIHQVKFQVVAVNGVAQPVHDDLDTVRVPERGSVVIRLAFTDRTTLGRFVFHCHVLKHEDHGMMAVIEVYDPNLSFANRVADWFGDAFWAVRIWQARCHPFA